MTQPPRDRETTIVTDGGDRGPGMMIAAILGILAIIFVIWLLFFTGADDNGVTDVNVTVVPGDVDVTVDPGDGNDTAPPDDGNGTAPPDDGG